MTSQVSYQQVNVETPAELRTGFVTAYQETFGGAPYFEHYTEGEVATGVWEPHTARGIVILALQAEQVIGFGCALPLRVAPSDVQEFLRERRAAGEFPADFATTWYMSEMGVLEPFRRNGIGKCLIRERLAVISRMGDTHYVLRTAAIGSNSAHLYLRLGAAELADRQDVSALDQVQINQSQSTKRSYLYGSCAGALARL